MAKIAQKKAICILSGGMDSTLASYIAKNDGYEIIAVHFNYGQRTQDRELKAFRDICNDLKILEKYEIDIPFFTQIGASALTDKNIDVPTNGIEVGVPVTYVPFRNGIFLSIAAAVAEKEEATAMYIGVVQEDSSGYPDCTDDFINDMKNGEEYELSREDMSDWIIYTPSMTINANNVYMYNKLYNNAGSERNS